jgi:hypothetical protein
LRKLVGSFICFLLPWNLNIDSVLKVAQKVLMYTQSQESLKENEKEKGAFSPGKQVIGAWNTSSVIYRWQI